MYKIQLLGGHLKFIPSCPPHPPQCLLPTLCLPPPPTQQWWQLWPSSRAKAAATTTTTVWPGQGWSQMCSILQATAGLVLGMVSGGREGGRGRRARWLLQL